VSERPILIPRAVGEAMLQHARDQLPNEACGFASGTLADHRVSAFHPARNAYASPSRFSVDAADQVRITFEIERAGEDLVAIFHSHPRAAAEPSPTDRREASYPEQLHLLATLVDPDAAPERALRAWRLRGDVATEVPLELD